MRTRAVRPERLDYEYELYISKGTDSILKKQFILFDFRTKKLFENFAYKMHVIPEFDEDSKELKFNIEGLSAPRVDISKEGPASFEYKFFDYKNSEYSLRLTKYLKQKTLFKIKITPKSIKVILNPKKTFIKVIAE